MKILVLGNQGYIGPVLTRHLCQQGFKMLDGLDTGYFAHCLTSFERMPEFGLNIQFFKDVRDLTKEDIKGYDALIYLAAISNDPMGKMFEQATTEINQEAAVDIAEMAAAQGVQHFVYASSCSVYGAAAGKRHEKSELNPLTTYARSKIATEQALAKIVSRNFQVTCLRFATACGWSPRLRLDLVLNDFVASAVALQKIEILSDGTPWRPLIHVKDMARAIEWALVRVDGENFIAVNVGSDQWNYQVQDLANAVAEVIPNTYVQVNRNAPHDKRSYQVDFSMYESLAPKHQPQVTLRETIQDLWQGLQNFKFREKQFRESKHFIRLNTLRAHLDENRISKELKWL